MRPKRDRNEIILIFPFLCIFLLRRTRSGLVPLQALLERVATERPTNKTQMQSLHSFLHLIKRDVWVRSEWGVGLSSLGKMLQGPPRVPLGLSLIPIHTQFSPTQHFEVALSPFPPPQSHLVPPSLLQTQMPAAERSDALEHPESRVCVPTGAPLGTSPGAAHRALSFYYCSIRNISHVFSPCF